MDPNSVLMIIAIGSMLGIFLGFMISAEGYGWMLNAISGGFGAMLGTNMLTHTQVDMGPMVNGMMLAIVFSSATAMVLKS